MDHRRPGLLLAGALAIVVSFSVSFAGCIPNAANDDGAAGDRGRVGQDGGGGGACVPSGATGPIPPTFETVRATLRGGGPIMSCASADCHGLGGHAPPDNPLILQNDANLYANMTSYVAAACGSMKLVNPGKPNESALIKILRGPCGSTPRMPNGCSDADCIPEEYVVALEQWISNCAPAQ